MDSETAREELLTHLVWGRKWRLTHFTDFPCCRRPAYSHCEIMKWVALRVREHMTGEFELYLFRGKEFKDKRDKMDKNPGHSLLNPAGKWDFYLRASSRYTNGITVYHPPCACNMQERWDHLQILAWKLVTGLNHFSVVSFWDWKHGPLIFFFLIAIVVFKVEPTVPSHVPPKIAGRERQSLKLSRTIETMISITH